jgi:hypothetical protein
MYPEKIRKLAIDLLFISTSVGLEQRYEPSDIASTMIALANKAEGSTSSHVSHPEIEKDFFTNVNMNWFKVYDIYFSNNVSRLFDVVDRFVLEQ